MNNKAKLNPNLVSGKIRQMLHKNPDAGYEELKAQFGTITRSIRVTYYRIHKEMFQNPGSLKRPSYKSAPIRTKIIQYFTEHPNHTIVEAAKNLNMGRYRVYHIVYNARLKGIPVSFRKMSRSETRVSIAKAIRVYMAEHPNATSKECAEAVGAKTSYVSLIRYRDNRQKCVSA